MSRKSTVGIKCSFSYPFAIPFMRFLIIIIRTIKINFKDILNTIPINIFASVILFDQNHKEIIPTFNYFD